jgi:hypothetical protein
VCQKYAQNFYGADLEVAQALLERGVSRAYLQRPIGDHIYIETHDAIHAHHVLFIGISTLSQFNYERIRKFSRKVLSILVDEAPNTEHVAMTIHGPGYGLDETESAFSQFAGLIDAIRENQLPQGLNAFKLWISI